jgi:hypothetical protein
MLYWLMDSGGTIARRRHPIPVDFASLVQSTVALALLGLVVARAVNAFT